MSVSPKNQIIWGLGLFFLIFFWTNIFWDYGERLITKTNFSKSAAIFESVVIEKEEISLIEPVIPKINKNIKLAFVGDMMLDRGVKNSVYKNFSGDYVELFSKVREELQSYDILFANLEGPISDKGEDVGGLYSFRFEPKAIPALSEAGFDVFSLANNHAFNWGEVAFTDTIELLSSAGISSIGAGVTGSDAYLAKIFNIQDVRIAYLAFSEFRAGGIMSSSTDSGFAMISEEDIKKSVSQAESDSDLVIVSYHFGEEYMDLPNEYQKKYAKLAIDYGADLIIGHHPHVVQTLEQYKNTYIIYSLGNFIFDQYFSPETMQGGLLEVEVNSQTKKIEKVNLKKVLLNRYFQIEGIE
jgi:gamma-polyglutamate biosynthesis protein CapA